MRDVRHAPASATREEEAEVSFKNEEVEEPEDFYYGEPLPDGGFAHVVRFMGHEVVFIHRRSNYRSYNETPMKGHLDMNTKAKKFLVKRGIEFIFAAAIGYLIKTEKKIESRVDDHFAPPKVDETEED